MAKVLGTQDENFCSYTIDENHIFFPDVKGTNITGFHSTARALNGINYEWVTEPPELEADYEPFTGEFRIPGDPALGTKVSSFFPMLMLDSDVLRLIGEAYEESGCRPFGFWSASVTNSLINECSRIRCEHSSYATQIICFLERKQIQI